MPHRPLWVSPFCRSVGSGNRCGQVAHLPTHAQDTFASDLVCPAGLAFVIESKAGYDDVDLHQPLTPGNAALDTFLQQVPLASSRLALREATVQVVRRKLTTDKRD